MRNVSRFLQLIGILVVSSATAERTEAELPTGGFDFAVEGETSRLLCSGVLLSADHALTAGHCVSDAASIEVRCGDQRQDTPVKVDIARAERHPTHDLGMLIFKTSVPCPFTEQHAVPAGKGAAVALVGRRTAERTLPRAEIRGGDEHVLFVETPGTCLRAGQSGTPLFLKREHDDARVLAGLLIRGPRDCGGEEVFLRLDRHHAWINERLRHPV